MRRRRGYALVEVLASIAIFMVFLLVLVGLQREFIRFDREMRVQMFTHPAPLSVLARLQRDILDSSSYPTEYEEWTQTGETLLLEVPAKDESSTVIWDFTNPAIAKRLEFRDGTLLAEWEARAVPAYEIGSYEMPDGRTAVRVRSYDDHGRLSIDRIVTPRAK